MDVYLNTKRDLLVVKKGYPMPPAAAQGKWRKSKKRVIKVSDEIRSALQRQAQEAIRALFRVMNRYVGNLPPMPGVFPDYPAPVVRNVGSERELVLMRWGMPPPPRTGGPPVTNIRNTSSPHWRGWLKPESRCLVPFNSFAEYAPEPNPETKKRTSYGSQSMMIGR
jgi:putative SOS response-associated peptidase YedK